MADESLQSQPEVAPVEHSTADEFSMLLAQEFKPKTDRAKEAVETAVRTLAEQVLADSSVVTDDAIKSIQAVIAEIDKKLSEQINQILHNADFQKLEGAGGACVIW